MTLHHETLHPAPNPRLPLPRGTLCFGTEFSDFGKHQDHLKVQSRLSYPIGRPRGPKSCPPKSSLEMPSVQGQKAHFWGHRCSRCGSWGLSLACAVLLAGTVALPPAGLQSWAPHLHLSPWAGTSLSLSRSTCTGLGSAMLSSFSKGSHAKMSE